MSVYNITLFKNCVFEFQSFTGKILRTMDIVMNIIIYRLNKEANAEEVDNFDIIDSNGNYIKRLKINWFGNYGVVDLKEKWINHCTMNKEEKDFEYLNSFQNNYKIYVRGIYVNREDQINILEKQPLMMNKIQFENRTNHYLEDSPESFNAIELSKYKSLKLKFMGSERLRLTQHAMKVYKYFINKDFFLLGTNDFKKEGAIKIMKPYHDVYKMIFPDDYKEEIPSIEFESVRVF